MNRLIIPILTILHCISFACTGTTSISALSPVLIILSKTPDDTAGINTYSRKALTYISKPSKAVEMKSYIDSAELLCRRKNIELPSLLHLAKAEYFYIEADYTSASEEAKLAISLAEKTGETDILIKTFNLMGRYYLRTGSFNESINYFKRGNDIAEKRGMNRFIPGNLEGLANVYYAAGDINEYQNTLKLLISSSLNENDTLSIESGYFRLGTSLTENNRNQFVADSMLRNCLTISLIKRDTDYIILSLSNIGWNFYLGKQYDSSLVYYNKSLDYSIPSSRYSFSANSYGNMGTIFRDLGETDKSLYYYNKGIQEAKRVEDVYNLSWIYQDMSEMYLRKRDTSNAYLNYVLFKNYSDSLARNNNIKGINDAQIRYEAEAHNKELELLSLRIKNQRLLIYGFAGFTVLIIIIGLLLLKSVRINSRRRISEMSRKISEITQANLRQQMNPHFIFNTLNSIQYYMYQHDKLATNNYLTKFSNLMRKVLENSQHTSIPLSDELEALTLYLELEKIRFKDKFDYNITLDDEIDILLYKVPTMLIQPYVENSICHGLMPGDGNGLVSIRLELKDDYLSCTIEDNGIGREASKMKKNISDINHNSLGTRIVSSRLDLVNSLYGTSLKTIYTDMKNDEGEPVGTRVEIHIPILT